MTRTIASSEIPRFGELALRAKLITEEQLEECVAVQERFRTAPDVERMPRFGEVLAGRKLVTIEQVKSLLNHQRLLRHNLFGELAVQQDLITREQLDDALHAQSQLIAQGETWRVGDVLALRGLLSSEQIATILHIKVEQQKMLDAQLRQIAPDEKEVKAAPPVPPTPPPAPVHRTPPPPPTAPGAPPDVEPVPETPLDRPKRGIEIGGYEAIDKLGADATGILFKAQRIGTEDPYSLRILSAERMADPAFAEAFKVESMKAIALEHPSIMRMIEVGSDQGHDYYVCEYIEGRSVKKMLDEGHDFSAEASLEIALQTADALAYAHSCGVTHGSLRPSNIVISRDGTVKVTALALPKVLDQNIERFASDGETVPAYTAPEQATENTEPDPRSDIYALGAILYHMLTGKPPYEGTSLDEILNLPVDKRLKKPSRIKPEVPETMSKLVVRMMEVKPLKRFQLAGTVVAELRRIQKQLAGG